MPLRIILQTCFQALGIHCLEFYEVTVVQVCTIHYLPPEHDGGPFLTVSNSHLEAFEIFVALLLQY